MRSTRGPGGFGVVAKRLGHVGQVRHSSLQSSQRFQSLDRAFQLPGAAADMLGQPGQHVRIDIQRRRRARSSRKASRLAGPSGSSPTTSPAASRLVRRSGRRVSCPGPAAAVKIICRPRVWRSSITAIRGSMACSRKCCTSSMMSRSQSLARAGHSSGCCGSSDRQSAADRRQTIRSGQRRVTATCQGVDQMRLAGPGRSMQEERIDRPPSPTRGNTVAKCAARPSERSGFPAS